MDRDTVEFWNLVVNCVIAASAFIALFIAMRQTGLVRKEVDVLRKQSIEQTNAHYYDSYYRLCVQHPDLADPAGRDFDFVAQTLDGDRSEFRRYEFFVGAALTACERLHESATGAIDWENHVETLLSYHANYLRSLYFQDNFLDELSVGFRAFVQKKFPAAAEQAKAP